MNCFLNAIFVMMIVRNSNISAQDVCGKFADFQLIAENSRADVIALLSDFTPLFSVCAHLCLVHKLCKSFNYNGETLKCEILSYSHTGSETKRLLSSSGWAFYHKTIRAMVCVTLL